MRRQWRNKRVLLRGALILLAMCLLSWKKLNLKHFLEQTHPQSDVSILSGPQGEKGSVPLVDNNCPDSNTRETTSRILPQNAAISSLSWTNSNDFFPQEIFSTCAPTVQVRLYPKCRQWELQSLDWYGNPKSVGGDEYYITYTDTLNGTTTPKVTAVAWVVDQNNGRYLLDFQCSPFADCAHWTGSGVITLYFQYTCGMGRINPPQKSAWLTGGNIVSCHTLRTSIAPPIRAFEPPEYRPNLYDFDFLIPVGDSMMQHFLQPLGRTFLGHPQPLNTSTVMQWKAYISSQYGNTVRLNSNRTALLLGSAVWDLLEDNAASNDNWENHGQAWHKLIGFIKSTYPQVTIFWKSATALHIHKTEMIGTPQFYKRLKYMSVSRSWELYHLQKQWCAQQGVLFLDVYAATYLAADETLVGDGRHFTQRFNTRMIHWFVNESHVERLWRQRQLLIPKSGSTSAIRPLIPSKCHSWTDLVNAVLVAVTTNRLVVWDPSICSLAVDQNAFPFVPSSSNNLAMDSLPLKGFDDVVLDREKLEQHGLLPSKPFQRLATALFSQGADYLYGMILQSTLPWPHHTEVTSITKNFSQSVVAVLGNPTLQTEKVQNCLDQIVRDKAKSCVLRVLSPELEKKDLGSLVHLQRSQLSCAIEPFHPKLDYLQSLYEVAMVADGLVLPCGDSYSMLSKGLVEYLRQSIARRKGRLPLDDLPFCCY